jgi:alpha-ketoglutarate-dependent taurine dioxygenase
MTTTASHLRVLPEDWRTKLSSSGHLAYNLAERLGGPGAVTDDALGNIAAQLATLAPGLSCGPVMHIQEEPGATSTPLTRASVPFHNDRLFLYKPMHYLVLYCDVPAEEGGDTLLVRGDVAFRRLSTPLRESLEGLRVRIRYGECCVTRSLLETHPLDGSRVLLFFDPAIATDCTLEVDGQPLAADILTELRAVLAGAEAHRQRWRIGDVLIIDNFKMLHGRTAYAGRRLLRRVHVGPHASRA